MRGVYTIPSTPFDERGQLDQEGLRRIVDFCVACGAHGLVYPVNASEFTTLSDQERLTGSRIVVEQAAGRIPVVIGVAGVCAEHAAMFGREAMAMGADAVIAMSPYIRKITDEGSQIAYFRSISDAVNVPIFVQNHSVGSELSVPTLVRLVREVEHVEYIKEETMPTTHQISRLLEMAGPKLKGVFGGAGGRYLLLEHPRGCAGQMPGCHVTDVVVRLWNALEAGDLPEAKRVYGLMAPLFAMETMYPGTIYKEVLRRRGVIRHAGSRNAPAQRLDEQDHRALDDILADLEPLFTYHG
ncbi:MAG: dihydrodipicolinate synthase family protein [Chloroflexi bacterium]|jgi:dihydrodipicolinate synthase/N-acetylneuraminate lyase|nr:dihydrodipicolinate synthase family protein [Chloroflexota bacterium]